MLKGGCMENISGTDYGVCDVKRATSLNDFTNNSLEKH